MRGSWKVVLFVGAKKDASEPTSQHVIATLSSEPRGLVACAGFEFFMDGSELYSIDTVTLGTMYRATSLRVPAGGLACDSEWVYWATLSDADASVPNGEIERLSIVGNIEQIIVTSIDPSSGIDGRDAGVYVMTSSGLGFSPSGDAGLIAWMPATISPAYKPFALTTTGDWAIDNQTILRRAIDAGAAATWLDTAGQQPTALVAANGSTEPLAIFHTPDSIAEIIDDAGGAALIPIDASNCRDELRRENDHRE